MAGTIHFIGRGAQGLQGHLISCVHIADLVSVYRHVQDPYNIAPIHMTSSSLATSF